LAQVHSWRSTLKLFVAFPLPSPPRSMSGSIRKFNALVAVVLASLQASQAAQISGRITIPSKFAADLPAGLGLASAKVVVDGGAISTLPTSDGYFVVNDISNGPHLLQVVHPRLIFDPVRVEAEESKNKAKISAYMADMEHGRGRKMKYPLGLAPSGMFQYMEKREDFNILSIFMSPMTLMMLFMMGMMFVMPKLQPMLEEEKRQRLEAEQQGKGGGGSEPIAQGRS